MVNNPLAGLCLYTLGYAVSSAGSELEQFMSKHPDALLIDTRYRPASRYRPMWNKKALQARWQGRYQHERQLGNVNYQVPGAPILLVDYEDAIERLVRLLVAGQPLLLLCACGNYDVCHREVIVDLIRQRLEGNEWNN